MTNSQKRTRGLPGLFFAFAAGLSIVAAPASGVVAEPKPDTTGLPKENKPEAAPEVDRGKLLSDLYGQLVASKDEESAKLVADAIEKLWLASGSDTVDLLMGRALKSVEEKEHDIALRLLDAVVAIRPNYAEGWNQRATVYYLKQDYRSSLNDLRQVLAIDPKHFKAINGLALIMQELGDKKAALTALRKGLKVHPFLGGAKQSEKELSRDVEGQGI